MHPFLAKTAATMMAMVMATTASLCRCGMGACDRAPRSTSIQQSQETAACPNHCPNNEPGLPAGDAPAKCTNCAAPDTAVQPQATPATTSIELHAFDAPPLDAFAVVRASSRSLNVRLDPLEPPIDVLLQSCILLI